MSSLTPNPSLAGEKLLILVEWELQSELLDRLRQNYPGLEVAIHRLAGYTSIANDLPEAMLKDVTILLTYRNFPAPEHAPKLKYVQLMSAGCNHIMENPLYTEREVAFCTANGVHPPQIAEWVIATFLAHQLPNPPSIHLFFHKICTMDTQFEPMVDRTGRYGGLTIEQLQKRCNERKQPIVNDIDFMRILDEAIDDLPPDEEEYTEKLISAIEDRICTQTKVLENACQQNSGRLCEIAHSMSPDRLGRFIGLINGAHYDYLQFLLHDLESAIQALSSISNSKKRKDRTSGPKQNGKLRRSKRIKEQMRGRK